MSFCDLYFVSVGLPLMATSKTIIIIISYLIHCAVLAIPWSPMSLPPAKDEQLGMLTCAFQFLMLETASRSLNSPYSVFNFFTTLTENADPPLGGGSQLGVPSRGALLGRVEQGGGKGP